MVEYLAEESFSDEKDIVDLLSILVMKQFVQVFLKNRKRISYKVP